jgi:predicted RecB family nuclease
MTNGRPITPDLVAAYWLCKRKAFLLLEGETGDTHEYVQLINARAASCLEDYLRSFEAGGLRVHQGQHQATAANADVIANLTIRYDYLEATVDALVCTLSDPSKKRPRYEPHLVLGTSAITSEDRIRLTFIGYVVAKARHQRLASGAFVNGAGNVVRIKLPRLMADVAPIIDTLKVWITNPPPDSPPTMLNGHCPLCPFRRRCLAQAEEEDNISLLDRMTPKLMQKYQGKGIFTVNQLSYLFRPRRQRRRGRRAASGFNVELQALALRTGKIYVNEPPSIPEHRTELFLDMEGVPDQGMHYLIGLIVSTQGHVEHHSLWADTPQEEQKMFASLLRIAGRYPGAPIYHYGSYEPKALRHMARKYGLNGASIRRRLVNVNAFVFGKVYFPTRSNTLKDLGKFVGATWTAPDASGLQSMVWRCNWEASKDDALKDRIITYNLEDCQAVRLLVSELRAIAQTAVTRSDVDFTDTPKQNATASGQNIHDSLERIIRSAHHDEYRINRISVEHTSYETIRRPSGGQKGHQGFRRMIPAKVDKVVRVRRTVTCPKDKGVPLKPTGKVAEHAVVDLVFTGKGCRKTITKYVGEIGHCPRCGDDYGPPAIRHLRRRVFGHCFRAWAVYQRITLQLPYSAILQLVKDLFRESLGTATLTEFVVDLAKHYAVTEKALLKRILASPFVHVNETKISIQGTDHYVWVLTDGVHVIFRLTETRESTIIKKILDRYDGVLISDFYGGYDACKCPQQKCLVHLIRDLNDDLWKNPYDSEIEGFISDFKDLLVPIMADVEIYGLKRRHLNKHRRAVDLFYGRTIDGRDYKHEVTRTYQKRFVRYRESLFRFLEEDGIPWNNNLAERAIRHLAIQRKISGSFFKRVTIQYLRLLGVAQSCRFQGKSFLGFLLSGEKDIERFKERRLPKTSKPVTAAKPKGAIVRDKRAKKPVVDANLEYDVATESNKMGEVADKDIRTDPVAPPGAFVIVAPTAKGLRYRGKTYTEREVNEVRDLIAQNPDASRWFLSKELCRRWNWVQANGVLKDMLCRGFLLMLHRKGLITLPPSKCPEAFDSRRRQVPPVVQVDTSPIVGTTADASLVKMVMVRHTPEERTYRSLVHQYHYLGYTHPVGEHLEYIVFSQGRPVACMGWCSAPRHIGCRDGYLGWSPEERIANLHKIVINTRFLVLPWVRISDLVPHLLEIMAKRISSDWETFYHHEVVWLETFVDPERGFAKTCYEAARWIYLGPTTGRGKNDNTGKANRSPKYVFGYPLASDFRKALYGLL